MEPTPKQFIPVFKKLLKQRGYVVIGQPPHAGHVYTIGETTLVFAQYDLPCTLRIISKTNSKDWIEQIETFNKLAPEWNGPKVGVIPRGSRFFRAVKQ